jgi:hypothetical protein
MNLELLKRLQLEAGGSHYPDINPDLQAKFAELIVRECAGLCSDPVTILQYWGIDSRSE